jgi:hypothetical protein
MLLCLIEPRSTNGCHDIQLTLRSLRINSTTRVTLELSPIHLVGFNRGP